MSNNSPSYEAIHRRVNRRLGPARQTTCVGCCVKRATEWAYDHRDPSEIVNDKGLRYSQDVRHYVPLCRTCHRRFDALANELLRGQTEIRSQSVKIIKWQRDE